MAVLLVPPLDKVPFPTLGPQVADFIRERCVFGPGSLAGRAAVLDKEKLGAIYRLYEVYPRGHRRAGQRRFNRGALEWRKGTAKTEFAAWVAFCELHPEAPVRFDGWDAHGNPVGRPVASPYVPMMATTEEQVSELAYGVLKYVVEHGPDSGLFDSSLDRIIRLDHLGRADGRALPVAVAPDSADGALTTFQHFDEPHRLWSPRQRAAHETMTQNLSKRPLEDPWSLYTSTAGQPGQGSVQEDVRGEAEEIDQGQREDPSLFFFARWAGADHADLSTVKARIAAIAEATGPVGEYGPGQFERIARDYDRKGTDRTYWERVYLNRWLSSGSRAFDALKAQEQVRRGQGIPRGAFVTLGFDGARRRDATAIVVTEVSTGRQRLAGLWEKPRWTGDWEVDEDEVTQTIAHLMAYYDVAVLYGDPPYWVEPMASWAGRWEGRVVEYATNVYKRMAADYQAYADAITTGAVTYVGADDEIDDLVRHIGNAGRKNLKILDDQGSPMWITQKPDGHRELLIDASVAATLSWRARLDVIRKGVKPKKQITGVPVRVR